ncbi:glycosyltransferase [Yokenella regensburgei]|uniref:glycosyltransferase n=1 Tax=Yokenella regensburgei TaxID=158877 RepID=UPI003EDB4A6B
MATVLKKQKIAVGIIVYNPTDNLSKRIDIVLGMGFDIYLLDNTPQNPTLRDRFQHQDNFHYLTLGKNVGLGIGMAAICGQAYYDGHESLVFFDQDTGFSADTLMFIVGFYEHNKTELSSFSMMNFNSKNIKIGSAQEGNVYDFAECDLVINSGSLINLDILKNIGWHDTSYFVDGVDYKCCLDSIINKYKIGECRYTPEFDHMTEQDDTTYNFLGKKFRARKYSSLRVRDSILSLVRLMITSVINFKFKYFRIFLRQFVIYVAVQAYVRLS